MTENISNSEFYRADNGSSHEDTLNAALAMYKKGEYETALRMYTDLLNYYTSPTLYLELGNCYYKLGKNKYALEFWKKVVELDSLNKTAYINMGNLYYKTRHLNFAIENWLTALTIEPDDAKVNLNLAIAYTDSDMRAEAIKYYEKYLRYEEKRNDEYTLIENKINSYKEIANTFLKEGAEFQKNNNNRAALDCYIKALAHYPNYSKTNFNIGSLFFMDHNYEQAVRYWLNSFYIDSAYPKTMLNLAISYDCMKKFDYAYCFYARYSDYILDNKEELTKLNKRIKQIKVYLNSNPYLIDNHLKEAEEHYRKNDLNTARIEYRNYIILKPEEKKIYQPLLQKINYYLNPEAKVIEELTKSATTLYNAEKFAEASLVYKKAIRLCDENSPEFSRLNAKFNICVRKAG